MSTTTPRAEQKHGAGYSSERSNGLTEEQAKELLAVAGRRKGDPSMDRLMEEVEKYREALRQEEIALQEDAERDK